MLDVRSQSSGARATDKMVKAGQKIASASKRVGQLLCHDTRDLFWLGYVLTIAPWAHRAAGSLHQLRRWQVRHDRQRDAKSRMEQLRKRVGEGRLMQGSYRVALVELCPELDNICRPLRRPYGEIDLADIDQDGFLCRRFKPLWPAPSVEANAFLPRDRLELTVVDRDGWVGVRKDFRGNKAAFVNELEASLDLSAAGCSVPAVLGVDFERLSITFAYIHGMVVREALAQAGAPMRDRELASARTAIGSRIVSNRLDKKRIGAGRGLIDQVLTADVIESIGKTLLAIHRAGYSLEDVKYGNIIIEATTNTPYFVDWERALPLCRFSRATATWLRDRDANKLNRLFGTNLPTAKMLRRVRLGRGESMYSPFYAGAGLWWGAIWNPELGMLRWRHVLAKHVPVPRGGRVLDLGANNGANALRMLRAGASEVVGVEIDPAAIEQGLFVKQVFEWADNTEYRFSYIHGSHADIGAMNLGRFDLITAFCTLYYLSPAAMAKTVSDLARLTDTVVLQCNNERSIERSDPETYMKASLAFNVELVRNNGFPNVEVIERRGSDRPLVIARTGSSAAR
jgi:tRNA A-37 threonylcarbamoyl transferase component Bud32/SAM-dependent methyltransferase